MPKRMFRYIRSFFNFSHAEARGFLLMVWLLAAFSLFYLVYRNLPARGWSGYERDQALLDSLVAVLETREPEQAVSFTGLEEAEAKSEVRYFYFNPNHLSADSLELLGMPGWLAQRIINYRQKGGRFREKEDMLKIYHFPDSLYQKLAPYIRIEPAGEEAPRRAAKRRAEKEEPAKPAPARSVKKVPETFSINEADSLQLQQVYGIGPVLSGRIIRFRERLGGFAKLSQLYEVYGLDSAVVERLREITYIREGFKPAGLAINAASQEELAAHPYISPAQARLIYNYRRQHGFFQSVDDLRKIHTLDANFVEKIAPYVRLE
jgi:competence protein ComEA